MIGLGRDFASTGNALPGYVQATEIDAFQEARHDSAFGMAKFGAGLLRITNLAIANALAGSYFEERAKKALYAQPRALLNVIWGSESELARDAIMTAMIISLEHSFEGRVSGTRILHAKHNMVNDIHLQAALLSHARTH